MIKARMAWVQTQELNKTALSVLMLLLHPRCLLAMVIIFSFLGLSSVRGTDKKIANLKEVAPVMAVFTFRAQDLCVFLNASKSQGDVVRYNWDFGDNEKNVGAIVAHCYVRPGKYHINLTVENRSGITESQGLIVGVDKFNQSPDAVFTYMDKGSQIYFDASESKDDESISSYLWDFGDGTLGFGEKVSHEFTANGNYEVVLTVTDNNGKSTMQRSIVGVFNPLGSKLSH